MDNKIKVTHVYKFAPPHDGGIESVMTQFFDSTKDEYELEVLSCSNKYKSSTENKIKNIRCPYLIYWASNCLSLSFLWQLHKVDTDILQYHMPYIFAVICHFIARPKYKKMFVTYHLEIVGYDKVMKPFWKLYKKFLSLAEKIFVVYPKMPEQSKMLNDLSDRCIPIPYGIDLTLEDCNEKVQQIKEKYKGKKILFSLGRFVPYKGFIYAVEAMKQVEDAVYLMGGNGPLKEEIQQYITDNGLQDKVILLGRISDEDLNAYYTAADVYLFPSVTSAETLGIVQLEAMKHSTPIINTFINTGVNYVSIDKETGLTVEPKNSDRLAEAIKTLLNNDELRLQYGQNARKRVEELFDIKKSKQKYIDLYKE